MKRRMSYDEPMAKMSRRGLSTLQKGQIAGYRFNKLQPWSTWGAARIPRGSPFSLNSYGSSYKSATADQQNNRRMTGFTGRGAYGIRKSVGGFLKKNKTAKVVYDKVMDAVGLGPTAAPSGSGLYTGHGMYTGRGLYSSNSLIKSSGSRPSIEFSSPNDETQSLIISHKEYVGDIFGPASPAFSNTTYSINPGLSQNFPFLAQFAQNFDEYELVQMVWEYHSTIDASAANNSAGNTGTIVMATNYKADSVPFQTKEEMIQYHGGVSGRLTEDLSHGVECEPSKNALGGGKFIRTALVQNSDLKTFDAGLFQLAMQNIPTPFQNQQVGELWVYYKVKLSKPKLFAALGNSISGFRAISAGGETWATGTGPMGSNILTAQANSIPCSISSIPRGISLTLPATLSGTYEIKVWLEGTSLAKSGSSILDSTGNVTGYTDIYAASLGVGDAPAYVFQFNDANNAFAMVRFSVKAATAGVNNVVKIYPIGETSTATSITQTYVELIEIGTSFATSLPAVPNPVFVNSSGTVSTPLVT